MQFSCTLLLAFDLSRYLGDDNGTVSVLQYDESSQQVTTLPYCIPAHITLGKLLSNLYFGITRGDFVCNCGVGILEVHRNECQTHFCERFCSYLLAGGLVKPGSSYAPSVVGILPQVDALFSR